MERKEFQEDILKTFRAYLDEVAEQRLKAKKVEDANLRESDPDLLRPIPDWPKKAWDRLRETDQLPPSRRETPYKSRLDPSGKHVPSVCFKVPTGGGKTMLAAECAARLLNNLEGRNTGLILWIVPNDAIYTQTLIALRDREHPYRQILDRAAAGSGNVRILEKDSPLNRPDIDAQLCVMVMMLQSARAKEKEARRIFRDSGDVRGFLPPQDDLPAHEQLLAAYPNLDRIDQSSFEVGFESAGVARNSLGNALRLCRPMIVMDEGHYAYTELAMETIYGLNPSFVLELSATPNPASNILVDVPGTRLDEAEMIKLPINVTVEEAGGDWKNCLRRAYDQTMRLQEEANRLHADTDRYIRPILLVQVERTGKDQRDSGLIHAKDAREFLQSLGVSEDEIAEKTAETDELKKFPAKELLKPTCPIRVIITKQALQEGWDCPYAYVLCSLAVSRNQRALTQLVGRILRQPEAKKTGRSLLDECYVYCHDAETGKVVDLIRKGLEEDGMGDLVGKVLATGPTAGGKRRDTLNRREKYATLKVYYPLVLWTKGEVRELDYERDILFNLDWGSVDMDDLVVETSEIRQTRFVRVDLGILRQASAESTQVQEASVAFDPLYATRAILDIVPNPWEARRIVGDVLDGLRDHGWDDDKLAQYASDVISTLRKRLTDEQERMAEEFFRRELAAGNVQFRLRADAKVWRMPETISALLPEQPRDLVRSDGSAIQNSVFRVFEHEFNNLEVLSARYLDAHNAVTWWHRNVARGQGGYALQGWRKNRVYPDLLIGVQHGAGKEHLIALETKGDQLAGNLDTEYKRALLKILTEGYSDSRLVGQLEIETGAIGLSCDMVMESNWQTRVSALLREPEPTTELVALEWIAATDVRHWCEGEPVLDWFDLYGKSKGYLKDTEREGYRPETDMSVFIREKGQAFERAVLELVSRRLTVETALIPEEESDPELRRHKGCERTLELMRAGAEAIYQGVVLDHEQAVWGKPDLLVRSDRIHKIVDIPPLSGREAREGAPSLGHADFHYVVVDIKFKLFNLLASGELGASDQSKKVQVAVYSRALGEMQGFLPPKAFLLGRSVVAYKAKGENPTCLGRLAPVTVASVLLEADEAASWVRRVRSEGDGWDVTATVIPEMQLNMSNTQDAPWHQTKRELAAKLRPLSALWQVSPSKAAQLIQAGVTRWDDPSLTADRFTTLSAGRIEVLRAVLGAQRSGFTATPPDEVQAGRDAWGVAQGVEFFVDFETVSDLDDPFTDLPTKGGSPRIFMVGCGHVENGEWRFSVFTANAMTDEEESRVLREWMKHMETVRQRLAPDVKRPLVFHWSAAEVSFLSSAYNAAITRLGGDWPEINWYDLLVNVIRAEPVVVKGALAFGLKGVAKSMASLGLIKTKWEDGPVDGLAAMVGAWWCAREAERMGIPMAELSLMSEIRDYNEVDCKVMWEFLTYLRGTS